MNKLKITTKSIKKYSQPLLILGACALVLSGAALAKYPEWVRVWAWEYPRVSYIPVKVEVCNTEKCKILNYIIDKFGDDASKAIGMIATCENSTFDQSRTNTNKNGTKDWGVFQVNDVHVKRYGEKFKTDWKANVDVAYEIYKAAGKKFTPWTCATKIGQTNYLGRAK